LNVAVVNALIYTYARCGSIKKAHKLFDKIHYAYIVSWTAMIVGYTYDGFFGKVLDTFRKM